MRDEVASNSFLAVTVCGLVPLCFGLLALAEAGGKSPQRSADYFYARACHGTLDELKWSSIVKVTFGVNHGAKFWISSDNSQRSGANLAHVGRCLRGDRCDQRSDVSAPPLNRGARPESNHIGFPV
jgi:hypothetical protein